MIRLLAIGMPTQARSWDTEFAQKSVTSFSAIRRSWYELGHNWSLRGAHRERLRARSTPSVEGGPPDTARARSLHAIAAERYCDAARSSQKSLRTKSDEEFSLQSVFV